MGACCTRDATFATITAAEMEEYEREICDEDHQGLCRGDFGASIRLSGSSAFVSMYTRSGKKGVNQDAMTVWEDFIGEKDTIFCGVFDGHGPCGHNVSSGVRDNLPRKIAASYKTLREEGNDDSKVDFINDLSNDDGDEDSEEKGSHLSSWKQSIMGSFKSMDKDLCENTSIDTYCSGATGVTVIKQGNDLIIANLGDSRAVLCTRGDKGQPIAVQLTTDLKPCVSSEAERITRCKGRVFALAEESDVVRIWQPEEDFPGLAMTRAFGDFCLKHYGVISAPQIFHRKLTEGDDFVVLATDGIWDVLSNMEVAQIVSSSRIKSSAAKLLVANATRAWRSRHPQGRIDDITAVCLFLDNPNDHQSSYSSAYSAASSPSNPNVEFKSSAKRQIGVEGEGANVDAKLEPTCTTDSSRFTDPC